MSNGDGQPDVTIDRVQLGPGWCYFEAGKKPINIYFVTRGPLACIVHDDSDATPPGLFRRAPVF